VVRSTPESADREMANTRVGFVPVTVRTKLTDRSHPSALPRGPGSSGYSPRQSAEIE
jgi:hypothetical protein